MTEVPITTFVPATQSIVVTSAGTCGATAENEEPQVSFGYLYIQYF